MKKLIKFKQEFLEKILDGSKTQTMRLPVSRVDVHENDTVIALFPNGEEIPLRITKVGYKSFKSINDEDAETIRDELICNGWNQKSVERLCKEHGIERCYGKFESRYKGA